MLNVNPDAPIFLYTGAADMRKSFDGLMGLVEQAQMGDLFRGWFVFCNRRGDRLKILYFDRDGLAIWYKRLERGRFQWPSPPRGAESMQIEPSDLRLILDGIDVRSARQRKRYKRAR
jgi:transposase